MKMERMESESYLAFADRVTQALADGLIDYEEWSKSILGDQLYSEENLRRCYQFFKRFIDKLDQEEVKTLNDDKRLEQLKQAKEDLIKERKRLQTVNLEAQDYYRTVGRNELFNEKIQEAIKNLQPIESKYIKFTYPAETTGLLIVSDQHYDSNFEVKGLFGETVNKYDKHVFMERMWRLLGMMENDRFDYDHLVVVSCGDALEGLLRMTSLQKLRGNVIDSALEFAEFMANWLVAAQERLAVPITFNLISGNHDVTRSLTQKPEFPEETLAKVIHAFIKLRLKDCEDIKVEDYGDVWYLNLYGQNLMFAHGEANDLNDLANYYENLYNVEIDCLYAGHLHRFEQKTIGTSLNGDREFIRVPSLCGTDTFAKQIRKNAKAGAYFALYSDIGRELSKIYYLN